MGIKKVPLLALFFFTICLFTPKTSKAVDFKEVLTSEKSVIVKIQERLEYFFAFKVETKVLVLEKHAEKRLGMAQGYAEKGKNERVQNVLQSYLQIKGRQNDLLGKTEAENMLGTVEENTIEQQITMEDIKTKIDEDGKQKIVKVQEQVVNQIAQRIIEINGPEGQTEFFNKVEHVWAPGTGPGGEAGTTFAPGTSGTGTSGTTIEGGGTQFAPGTSGGGQGGVIIEGGTIQFAPGTSAGGPAGSDIKTVEIKTGGTVNDPVPVPDDPNYAPGTSGNSPGNTIDSGGETINPGTNQIDP
jgi:hypothetical protein